MARQLVFLALIFFAIVGFSCAQAPAGAPQSSVDNGDIEGALLAPGSDNEIGNTDEAGAPSGDDVVEGPVGGPVSGGAFGPSAEAPNSGAIALDVSAIAGTAAIAAVTSLFF